MVRIKEGGGVLNEGKGAQRTVAGRAEGMEDRKGKTGRAEGRKEEE